jgi:NTE family protein
MNRPSRARTVLPVVVLALSACAHVTNTALQDFAADPHSSYRFDPKPDRDTLVIVTLSGGGSRAAALAYGTLQMLGTMPGSGQGSLLDQVDIISSVSGGSVTAGWYALKGPAGLVPADDSNPLWRFLYHDWTANLAWRGLNPVSLAKYAFTPYQRSDVLADFFADNLFGQTTYRDVLQRYKADAKQPYVILNATDLGHEIGLTFTQGNFDFLCSDLNRYRLTDAVAASANFPLAFSAIGLQNYSPCDAQRGEAWKKDGPAQWISHYAQFDVPDRPEPYSFQLTELRFARQAKSYIEPAPADTFVHLLDGGLIDNLGVRSTLAIADNPARVPGLYLRLGRLRPQGYQNIRRVVYIVVNARKRDPASMDHREYPPMTGTTVAQMINTQLDNSILGDQDYLIAQLEATANRQPLVPGAPAAAQPFLSGNDAAQATFPVSETPHLRFYVAAVDFELIPDPACRDRFWALATSWGLPPLQTTSLINLAHVLLSRSKDLQGFYRDIGKTAPKQLDFTEVCRQIQM